MPGDSRHYAGNWAFDVYPPEHSAASGLMIALRALMPAHVQLDGTWTDGMFWLRAAVGNRVWKYGITREKLAQALTELLVHECMEGLGRLVAGTDGQPVAPRVTYRLLGFRQWRVLGQAPWIGSTGAGYNVWSGADEVRATHRTSMEEIGRSLGVAFPQERHRAPAPGCHCGLNAYHDLAVAVRAAVVALKRGAPRGPGDGAEGSRRVVGAVVARGNLEVHPDGFRAEYARPLALWEPSGSGPHIRLRAAEVARRLGIPALGSEDLAAYGAEFAEPVAMEHRPG